LSTLKWYEAALHVFLALIFATRDQYKKDRAKRDVIYN